MLFALLLVVAALEFLRSSDGLLAHIARVIVIGGAVLFALSLYYGDVLAAPARAAYSLIGLNDSHPNTVLLTTLGAASAGLAYRAGRRAVQTPGARPPVSTVLSQMNRSKARTENMMLALDAAGRIQLRGLAHNPKKSVVSVRVSRRMPVLDSAGRVQMWRYAGRQFGGASRLA